MELLQTNYYMQFGDVAKLSSSHQVV